MFGTNVNQRLTAPDLDGQSIHDARSDHRAETPSFRRHEQERRARLPQITPSNQRWMSSGHEVTDLACQLAKVPLFKDVAPDVLAPLIALAYLKPKCAGEFFFNEGDAAHEFFVLTSGRVKLTQLTPEGHQVVLGHIGPGDAFGGVGVFGDPTYPVSAETVESSAAMAWTSTTMQRVLEKHTAVALNALHFIADRLHDLQRRHRQLMTERVERRVARALLRLVREAGRRVDTGVEIDFPVSRQDIAEMTGTTLFTVSRLMSSWEERGILSGGRQHIVLLRAHALVAIAEDLPDT
jgi:CRP/FNR family transcriptional regulator, nitrogen oxide reductase regulator